MNYLSIRTLQTEIKAEGILYFLEGGHFLFRYQDKDKWESKFVTMDDVAASMTNTENDTGWISPGIIRTGHTQRGDWFIYATEPQRQQEIILLGEKISVPIPATVLIGVAHAYYLFAVKETYVTPKSTLYRAPFPNIYTNGRICWGSNSHPPAHHSRAAQVWDFFFNTPFNNHLAGEKSESQKDDITVKLHGLAGAKNYPLNDLISENTTLENQITRIIQRDWRN